MSALTVPEAASAWSATGGGDAVAVHETHTGVVFLVADRAYKLKKPLRFPFVDYRDRADREDACHAEVALNRRLAPDVYLGVADVAGPDGQPCDHLVVMRRLPDDRRLSALVGSADAGDLVDAVAHVVATFHATARRHPTIDAAAAVEAERRRWHAGTQEISAFARPVFDLATIERIDDLAERYLAGRAPLFRQRIADRRACDGHGDLLADDIFCLDDGPRILDCLEFDEQLRWGDGLADVAFLAMDLERLGRGDLSVRFLHRYAELAADRWPASLAHHHLAYRAHVRAKVSAVRWGQGDERAATVARALLAQSLRHRELARIRLVVVGGLPGTGKSTTAERLGERIGAVVLRSDEVRKELLGLGRDEHVPAAYGQGAYTAEHTAATYAELCRRARLLLGLGESVVIDASWSEASARAALREVARDTVAEMAELRCEVPPAVAAQRLAGRQSAGTDVSDADAAIAAAMAADADPWPEATVLDTLADPDHVVGVALEHLEVPTDEPSPTLPGWRDLVAARLA